MVNQGEPHIVIGTLISGGCVGTGKICQKSGGILMGTFVVLAVLILAVGLVLRSMIRAKKAGKSLQCGCDCSSCGGHCCSSELKENHTK